MAPRLTLYLFLSAVILGAVFHGFRNRKPLHRQLLLITLSAAVLVFGLITAEIKESSVFYLVFYGSVLLLSVVLFFRPLALIPPVAVLLLTAVVLYSPGVTQSALLKSDTDIAFRGQPGEQTLYRLSADQGRWEEAVAFRGEELYICCMQVRHAPWLFFKGKSPWVFCGFCSERVPLSEAGSRADSSFYLDPGYSRFLSSIHRQLPGIRREYRYLGPLDASAYRNYTLILRGDNPPEILER